MDQRAALLWYHDHVMGVTRLTVYAGLAGLWIIRDQRERELGLPEGPPFEVPLLVQDRNFGQAPGGRLTSELVHKTDPGTMEAFAPFTVVNGKVWPVHDVQPATGSAKAADPGQLLPYPDVMRFRAVAGHPARRSRPGRLATDITTPTQADLSGAVRRAVALAEQELDGRPNMVTLRELAVAADGDPQAPVITVVGQHGQTLARLRTAAVHFEDAATFFPVLGRWEVWQLINLTGDTHPIHVHLERFHVLARRPITVTVPGNGIGDRDTTATVRLARDPGDELDHVIDANERGLKDTVRVNPHEIVELAIRFQAYSGRYMYHCHILEHEDRDMMRPIVIMPAQLMPFMS
jgi:spore coat protein A